MPVRKCKTNISLKSTVAFCMSFYQAVLAKPQLLFLNSKFPSAPGCKREGDLGWWEEMRSSW